MFESCYLSNWSLVMRNKTRFMDTCLYIAIYVSFLSLHPPPPTSLYLAHFVVSRAQLRRTNSWRHLHMHLRYLYIIIYTYESFYYTYIYANVHAYFIHNTMLDGLGGNEYIVFVITTDPSSIDLVLSKSQGVGRSFIKSFFFFFSPQRKANRHLQRRPTLRSKTH